MLGFVSMFSSLFCILVGFGFVGVVLALGEERVITFPSPSKLDQHDSSQVIFGSTSVPNIAPDSFVVASAPHKHSAPLLLDSRDDEAIHVAAQTFAEDIYRVTGLRPELYNDTLPTHIEKAIVVGSVSSRLVRSLHGEMEYVDGLKGKWESFDVRVMSEPVKGLEEGLVVVGSDRVSCDSLIIIIAKVLIVLSAARSTPSSQYPNKWVSHPSISGPTSPSVLTQQ